jgi:TPR repeat protein
MLQSDFESDVSRKGTRLSKSAGLDCHYEIEFHEATRSNPGNADAQANLGWHYATGDGVPKDLSKAAELYQKAADQGNAMAQNNLGELYQTGDGVPKDLGKAAALYQKAADQGTADAQDSLGQLYETGQGSK